MAPLEDILMLIEVADLKAWAGCWKTVDINDFWGND